MRDVIYMICIVLQTGLYGDSFTSKISKAGSKQRMEEHRYQGQSRCISQIIQEIVGAVLYQSFSVSVCLGAAAADQQRLA